MACCPLYAVQTSSVKIIETCGAFKTIARPGLNCLIPFVDNIATTVSMRLQQMEIACETKSRDNVRVAEKEMACECAAADADADRRRFAAATLPPQVFLTIRVAIQYQVIANDDAIKASYYRLTNPKQQVESYVYDVIRSTVPKINLDDGAATYHRWNRPHPLTHACPAAVTTPPRGWNAPTLPRLSIPPVVLSESCLVLAAAPQCSQPRKRWRPTSSRTSGRR